MATFTLDIDLKSKIGKAFFEHITTFAKASNCVSIKKQTHSTPKGKGISEGLADIKAGRVEKIDNVKMFLDSI